MAMHTCEAQQFWVQMNVGSEEVNAEDLILLHRRGGLSARDFSSGASQRGSNGPSRRCRLVLSTTVGTEPWKRSVSGGSGLYYSWVLPVQSFVAGESHYRKRSRGGVFRNWPRPKLAYFIPIRRGNDENRLADSQRRNPVDREKREVSHLRLLSLKGRILEIRMVPLSYQ